MARNLLKSREGDVARGLPVAPRMGRIRVGELADDLLLEYEVNTRWSLRDLRMPLRRHIVPYFGHRYASCVTTADVIAFTLKRQCAGSTNAEINRELAALKRAFTLGIRGGKIPGGSAGGLQNSCITLPRLFL